jgi:hypothetical protein
MEFPLRARSWPIASRSSGWKCVNIRTKANESVSMLNKDRGITREDGQIYLDKYIRKFADAESKAAGCKMAIIAGFWKTLPNFADHEQGAFALSVLHLEALMSPAASDYLPSSDQYHQCA